MIMIMIMIIIIIIFWQSMDQMPYYFLPDK